MRLASGLKLMVFVSADVAAVEVLVLLVASGSGRGFFTHRRTVFALSCMAEIIGLACRHSFCSLYGGSEHNEAFRLCNQLICASHWFSVHPQRSKVNCVR